MDKCCHKRRKAVTSTAPGRDLVVVGIHQMEPPEHTSDKQAYYTHLSTPKDERLSWPGFEI